MPRKKKGKGSKFARMSDEERTRYLQHRADLELEAKRRKQQLIAIFTKNKLKREEVFARINTAKINERWRSSLRKLKCTELKEDVEQLWKNFEGTLKTKDDFIKQLFSEIAEADIDHHRFQEAHMMVVDDILEKGKERIKYLHNNYLELVRRIKTNDIDDIKNVKMKMKESLLHLKTVIFGQNKLLEEELMELKTRNAVNIYNIVFSKEQSMLRQEREIYPRIESLRRELNGITTNYENSTDSKRKQYEYLKEQDDAYQEEAALFPKLFLQMKQNAENLRKKIVALSQEREETIEDLKLQSDLLNKRVCKMRQEVKMAQTIDAVQLKQLSVLSNEAIKKLERNLNKCGEVQMMTKLCSDLESESVNVQKYILKNLQTPRDVVKADNKSSDYLKKVQGFKDYLYFIKEENNLIKQNLNNLIEENSRLKHSLRSYLISVSRMPTIRPCTRA